MVCLQAWATEWTACAVQFDRERIPERVVHARGASAKGFFEARPLLLGVPHPHVAAQDVLPCMTTVSS